jgi:hypothetical protein
MGLTAMTVRAAGGVLPASPRHCTGAGPVCLSAAVPRLLYHKTAPLGHGSASGDAQGWDIAIRRCPFGRVLVQALARFRSNRAAETILLTARQGWDRFCWRMGDPGRNSVGGGLTQINAAARPPPTMEHATS